MSHYLRCASVLCLALLLPAGAARAEELGRVYFEVPGLSELGPHAESAESGQLLQTVNEGAVVHLVNRQVLRLEPNTALKLEAGASAADIRVRVLSGRVKIWSAEEGVLQAGAGSWFVLGASLADPLAVEETLMREPAVNARSRQRTAR